MCCWLDIDCQFIRAGKIDMTTNLTMIEREKFFEASIAVMQ
jgi:hypothetical protein